MIERKLKEFDDISARRERAENRALLLLGAGMVCMIGVVVCFIAWRFL